MNLRDGYLEEDLFPKLFTNYEERSYGILFYNEENRDSYDSNHAVIYKDKIDDLGNVLADVIQFYRSKNLRPIIYQSMLDDGWFEEIENDLARAGFKSWTELQQGLYASATPSAPFLSGSFPFLQRTRVCCRPHTL